MKKQIRALIPLACMALMCSCGQQGNDTENRMDRFIDELMGRMTIEQKLGQMNLVTGGDMVTGHVMTNELEKLIRGEEIGGVFNVKVPKKFSSCSASLWRKQSSAYHCLSEPT